VARFPPSLTVCAALSGGDQPIGFYAWIGRRTDCDAARPPSTSEINVTAAYNATFRRSPTLACRNGEVPRGSGIDLRGLVFPHFRSVRCAIRRPDGSLEILVATQAGRWGRRYRSPELRGAPLIDYFAVLKTRPNRLGRDMAMFRSLVANTAITPIVRE
jgi:hypothetical protein